MSNGSKVGRFGAVALLPLKTEDKITNTTCNQAIIFYFIVSGSQLIMALWC